MLLHMITGRLPQVNKDDTVYMNRCLQHSLVNVLPSFHMTWLTYSTHIPAST